MEHAGGGTRLYRVSAPIAFPVSEGIDSYTNAHEVASGIPLDLASL